MNDAEPDSDATAKTIEHTFGDRWGIWLSTTGHWWAALRNTLTAADLNAGCVPFLRAATQTNSPTPFTTKRNSMPQQKPAPQTGPPAVLQTLDAAGNRDGQR